MSPRYQIKKPVEQKLCVQVLRAAFDDQVALWKQRISRKISMWHLMMLMKVKRMEAKIFSRSAIGNSCPFWHSPDFETKVFSISVSLLSLPSPSLSNDIDLSVRGKWLNLEFLSISERHVFVETN